MKKFLLVLLSTASFSIANAEIINIVKSPKETIARYFKGEMPDSILLFPRGSMLPLNHVIDGDTLMLRTRGRKVDLAPVIKPFYMKMNGDTPLFSSDGGSWGTFLEFFTGKFDITINIINDTPVASLRLTLNQR